MTKDQNFSSISVDFNNLQSQVLDLRRQLVESRARNRAMWTLLAEVSQKLQASSTSIKAAVSSLLDYDIFWDGSTQHEFLETINDSVDQGTNLIVLMTLAFRSETDSLEMKPEPHTLQEILSTVLDTISVKMPGLQIKIDFPSEGRPVLVDYGYLAVALRFLLEALISSQIELLAVEVENGWVLNISGIEEATNKVISDLCQDRFDELVTVNTLSPENTLKLFTAFRILRLQSIELYLNTDEAEIPGLQLTIPAAVLG
jgi:K+-sensing histidine kinase KdpD